MRLIPMRRIAATGWRGALAVLAALALAGTGFAPVWAQDNAETFTFDLAEIEKKPWRLGGFVEGTVTGVALDTDAALYRLRFFDEEEQPERLRSTGIGLQLEGGYEAGPARFDFRVLGTARRDELGTDDDAVVQEAYLGWRPAPSATLEAGKRVTRWGTGYAFNPVAFVERPKDPSDPERSREGFVMARGEVIRSFGGALRNAALTLVALPVEEGVNEDFGPVTGEREWNTAGRLYLLLWETDIDLLALGAGTRSARYGLDFSRNVTSNFEVHGEWARITAFEQPVADEAGRVTRREGVADSWLLGVRYLTAFDLTAIAEVYHDGRGYTADELAAFYRFVDSAYDRLATRDDPTALEKARTLLSGAYGRPNPGRNYAYLRLSQKEPFDILYVTPALTALANQDDGSHVVTPEVGYTGLTNLEVRLSASWFNGARFTEFSEKQNDAKAELRLRYFF